MTDSRNIALRLCYDGSAYHGWQAQKNAVTVSGVLTQAIEKTVGHGVKLCGCGRTDAGVHAKTYVANFRTTSPIPLERLPFAINSRLPSDIAVLNAAAADDGFHAINSCILKEYTYYIFPSRVRNPFLNKRALFYPHPVNLDIMQSAAKHFVGEHDFASMRSMGTDVKSTVREMYSFEIQPEGELIAMKMSANGFLYNMARAIAGTVLYVNEGKITDIPALLKSGDRTQAGPVLPPHGLYMTFVGYHGYNV